MRVGPNRQPERKFDASPVIVFGRATAVAQRFPIHHIPHRRRADDICANRFPVRPHDHSRIAWPPEEGSADSGRRSGHPFQEGGHSDHGRADDPCRGDRIDAALGQSVEPAGMDSAWRDPVLRCNRFLRRLSESLQGDRQGLFRPHAFASGIHHCRRRLRGDHDDERSGLNHRW